MTDPTSGNTINRWQENSQSVNDIGRDQVLTAFGSADNRYAGGGPLDGIQLAVNGAATGQSANAYTYRSENPATGNIDTIDGNGNILGSEKAPTGYNWNQSALGMLLQVAPQTFVLPTVVVEAQRLTDPVTGSQLPPVENMYTPVHGYFQDLYARAQQGLSDPNSSLSDQAFYAVAGAIGFIGAILESPITELYNAANNASLAGQFAAKYGITEDINDLSGALYTGSSALLGLAGAASLLPVKSFGGVAGSGDGAIISNESGSVGRIDNAPATNPGGTATSAVTDTTSYVTLYRADATAPTQFVSKLAQTEGIDASNAAISQAESRGSVSSLFEDHALNSGGSPYISLTTSREVAESFARGPDGTQAGFVTEFRLPANFAEPNFENLNSLEREYLAPTSIDNRYISDQYQVTPTRTDNQSIPNQYQATSTEP